MNLSIQTGIVPRELKNAIVVPLYKKNKRSDVSNYRPVSVLSVASKILELEGYLVNNHLLYEFQSGFRSKFSTDTCLSYLTDFIKHETSEGLYTDMIMLYLQKALDTVDHLILCEKLRAMGVGSVDWIMSYLSGRNQFVQVNGNLSDSSPITCGVPQGSILGRLLFLCYVNDMTISVSSECKILLYADDSAILFSHKDPEVISRKLSSELESCSKLLVDNKLSLHLGKTDCILYGSGRKFRKVHNSEIECNGHTIKA